MASVGVRRGRAGAGRAGAAAVLASVAARRSRRGVRVGRRGRLRREELGPALHRALVVGAGAGFRRGRLRRVRGRARAGGRADVGGRAARGPRAPARAAFGPRRHGGRRVRAGASARVRRRGRWSSRARPRERRRSCRCRSWPSGASRTARSSTWRGRCAWCCGVGGGWCGGASLRSPGSSGGGERGARQRRSTWLAWQAGRCYSGPLERYGDKPVPIDCHGGRTAIPYPAQLTFAGTKPTPPAAPPPPAAPRRRAARTGRSRSTTPSAVPARSRRPGPRAPR